MSLENELVESSVVIANYREQIEDLKQLVKDYDALLSAVVHYTQHKGGEFWEELRKRAKDEGVDIKEPGA